MTDQRHKEDPRIDMLVKDVCALKKEMAANTEVTMQVRDMLAGFRVVTRTAKWITGIAAAVAATYTALKTGWDFHHPK